uniref:RRN3 homolog, RNA polymerase I transcription factor n=1 Tax=Capra hircus TaxID=9925 RepID=A0A8C2RXK8_CAPHI
MAAPLLHTRLPGDAAASASAVNRLGSSRTGLSDMLALENDFFNSPPRKAVRFGGTVTEVLLKYKKGETNDFELLKNQLSDPEIKDDQIINWLLEFRSSIMYLTKDFEQLINILLRLQWLNRSQTVVEEYLSFLGNLVSAQTVFLRPCLSMIASHFVPPRVVIKEGDVDVSDSDDEDENLLVNWLHVYLNNQDSGTKAFCDVALHGPFYSACQAVFYTFVFRHKQLLSGNLKEGLRYLQSLNFERIVMSQLNPLKICLPSVVNFFATITNKYQLVFCYTLIERNNRQMLPVIRNTAGGDSVQTCTNPLDTFFPFDPCVLKRWVLHSRPFGGEFKCGVYMPFPGSALRVSLSCVALLAFDRVSWSPCVCSRPSVEKPV